MELRVYIIVETGGLASTRNFRFSNSRIEIYVELEVYFLEFLHRL